MVTIIEGLLPFILLVSTLEDKSAVQYEEVNDINDKEYYSPDEGSENNFLNNDLGQESSLKEVYSKLTDTNVDHPDAHRIKTYSSKIRQKPNEFVDVDPITNKFHNNFNDELNDYDFHTYKSNKNSFKNVRNTKNDIDKEVLLKNDRKILQRDYLSNQKQLSPDEIDCLTYGTKINGSNLSIKTKRVSNNIANENIDTEDEENYEYLDDYAKSNNRNKCNDKCQKETPKNLIATPEKYSGKLCLPELNNACCSDDIDKNKTNQDNKKQQKDLGILQPIENHSANTANIANREYFRSKVSIGANRRYKNIPPKAIQNRLCRKYNKNEEGLKNDKDKPYEIETSRKLNTGKKIKSQSKSRHQQGLPHEAQHFIIRDKENKKIKDAPFYKTSASKTKEFDYNIKPQGTETEEEQDKHNINKQILKFSYLKNHQSADRSYADLQEKEASFPYKKVQAISGKLKVKPEPIQYVANRNYANNEQTVNRKMNTKSRSSNTLTDTREKNTKDDNFVSQHSRSHISKVSAYLTKNDQQAQEPGTNIIYNKFSNNEMLINGTNNITYDDSDYITDLNNNIQMNMKSKLKNSKDIDVGLMNQDYLTDAKSSENNDSEHNVLTVDNSQVRYKNFETERGLIHNMKELKKRSILDGEYERSFNDRFEEFPNRNENNIFINKPLKEKLKKPYYEDVDMNEENSLKPNRNSKILKDKDSSKQLYEDYTGETLLVETTHKKKINEPNQKVNLIENDTTYGHNLIGFSEGKYKHRKQTEISSTESDDNLATSSAPHISSIKYTGSSRSRYKDHASKTTSEKQCHPPAGPPKFKWCSEETSALRDQEYEDTLKGRVALRIVEVILAKVHKSSKMSHDFGFCKNQKKSGNMNEDQCVSENSILKSDDMNEIMESMEKLSCKSCNQLPPKLKEFLQWLVKVKSVRSVHKKEIPFGKYVNCSLGDSAFLFHQYDLSFSHNSGHPNTMNEASYNSPYETVSNNNQRNKVQNSIIASNAFKHDLDSLEDKSSNLELSQRELYNEKLKRYIPENKISYNFVSDDNYEPFLTKMNFPSKDLYLNPYNQDNDYYSNKMKHEQFGQFRNLKSLSRRDNLGEIDDFDVKPYGRDSNLKQYQYKKENKYKSNNYIKHNYEDLVQIRKKRNHKKSQLQDLMFEKQQNKNVDVQINEPKANDKLNEIIGNNLELEKSSDISDDSDQLGFYTPVVYRIPDDYESI